MHLGLGFRSYLSTTYFKGTPSTRRQKVCRRGRHASTRGYDSCMSFQFPRVYPILDASRIPRVGRAAFLSRLGASLAQAGVTLLEYRNKLGIDAELLADAAALRAALPAGQVKLILDDRADLIVSIGFDGVHVDSGDASPAEARRRIGPKRIIGTFGGSTEFLPGVLEGPADYLAVGPVFTSTTKQTATPPIGVEGVRRMRELAGLDRVITCPAGITLATPGQVIEAGATTVAVSAAIFGAADPAAEFQLWARSLA